MCISIKKYWIFPVLFLTLISLVTLTSCGDDDDKDKDEPKSSSVVGVWRHDFGDGYQLLTFEKNGKYSLVEFDFVSGNWSEFGTYSIKGDVMTRVLSDGDVEVYSILTLTAKKMILRYEGQYIGQYPNQWGEEVEDWTRVE